MTVLESKFLEAAHTLNLAIPWVGIAFGGQRWCEEGNEKCSDGFSSRYKTTHLPLDLFASDWLLGTILFPLWSAQCS